jgi:hypothetical protein
VSAKGVITRVLIRNLTLSLVQVCMDTVENLSKVNLRVIKEHHHRVGGRYIIWQRDGELAIWMINSTLDARDPACRKIKLGENVTASNQSVREPTK